jgi:HEAT repeat protein
VWAQALGTTAAVVALSQPAGQALARWFGLSGALSAALGFGLIQLTAIVAILGSILALRTRGRWRSRRHERVGPVIRDTLAALALGDDREEEFSRLHRRFPHEAERLAFQALSALSGSARDRLAAIMTRLGIVDAARAQCRSRNRRTRLRAVTNLSLLADPTVMPLLVEALDDDEHIRSVAASGLIRLGGPDALGAAFEFATSQAPLGRAILGESLRPHAATLAQHAIPNVLRSANRHTVRVALEMIGPWNVNLPAWRVERLLSDRDPTIRALVLEMVPNFPDRRQFETEVIHALSDEDATVRIAAAKTAGKLRLQRAVPELVNGLARGGTLARLEAAYALARMGPTALTALEQQMLSDDASVSRVALEALEKARIGQLPLAPL